MCYSGKKYKTFAKIISFVLLLSAVISILIYVPNNSVSAAKTSKEIQAEIDKLEQTIIQSTKALSKLQENINATNSSLTQTQKNKAYIENKMTVCLQNIEDTEALIKYYELLISMKEDEISVKKKQIEDEYNQFREWLRMSYEYGTISYLDMFFSSDSLTDFLMNAELVGNMMKYESKNLKSLDEALSVLNTDYESLEAYKLTLDEKKASLDTQKAEYDELLDEYDGSIKTLQANQTELARQFKLAQAEDEKLDKQLTKLLAELAAAQTSEYAGGEFIWPTDLSYKRISSYFGWRMLWGVKDYHRGIDIPAPAGTNIYASNSGKVISAVNNHPSYGNYIIIDHGGGYTTLYAHSSKLIAKVGDVVEQGDVIALVGTTGNSSGNHVHFEVRINGEIQDPLNYVVQP